jgi:hypothetical protein
MMSSNDYFSQFKNKAQEVEVVDIRTPKKSGRRKGVRSKLKWSNNYRKRVKNDKKENGLHHKLLKYSKDLNRSLSDMLELQWVKDLGIHTMNDMFIYAVREGFIYEKFKED